MEALSLPVPETQKEVVIAGRTFIPAKAGNTTFDQDLYITAAIEDAGIDKVFTEVQNADQLTQMAKRMIVQAYKSGKLWDVLAGVLIEKNIPWSHEYAASTARFFSNLTRNEDKEALNETMAGVVVGFFASAANSFTISQKSSLSDPDVAAFYDMLKQRNIGVSDTSDSGIPSSESSLATIPRSSTES